MPSPTKCLIAPIRTRHSRKSPWTEFYSAARRAQPHYPQSHQEGRSSNQSVTAEAPLFLCR
jgi:hypothetical protein